MTSHKSSEMQTSLAMRSRVLNPRPPVRTKINLPQLASPTPVLSQHLLDNPCPMDDRPMEMSVDRTTSTQLRGLNQMRSAIGLKQFQDFGGKNQLQHAPYTRIGNINTDQEARIPLSKEKVDKGILALRLLPDPCVCMHTSSVASTTAWLQTLERKADSWLEMPNPSKVSRFQSISFSTGFHSVAPRRNAMDEQQKEYGKFG